MSKVAQSHLTSREGIAVVDRLVSRLGWLFREQPTSDFGIDAHLEVVRDQQATGRLIGMQIKSGKSYFGEEVAEGFIHRGERKHLTYWEDHSLPILVVLVDPDRDCCYWQVCQAENIEETENSWKILIPKSQPLDESAVAKLEQLAEGKASELRLRRLEADRYLIEELAKGERVLLKINEWVNKSSGRGDFELVVQDAKGSETVLEEWTWLLAGWDYAEVLPRLFPWAKLEIDEYLYEDRDEDAWNEACGIWDSEDGRYIMHTTSLREFRDELGAGLRPYEVGDEVASWQLELTLNDVGKSFLVLDRYLTTDEDDAQS